jgi:hypothetical protein
MRLLFFKQTRGLSIQSFVLCSSWKESFPQTSFGNVNIPWLLTTRTKDIALIGDQNLEPCLLLFTNLKPGEKHEIVPFNTEHSAFTKRALPRKQKLRNPNHNKVILTLSTAFNDAYLKNVLIVFALLKGFAPLSVIEKNDKW